MDNKSAIASVICFGLALRAIVSQYPHSGQATSPMYGDYEAQRHWQEVTTNLPISEWYKNSTDNDLMYWGLDYPPLTAFHSYVVGKVAHKVDPAFVELHTSRGMETDKHKFFMRLTVLLADFLIYFPALVLAVNSFRKLAVKEATLSHLVVCIAFPGQILIDNGHFQYNNVSLGLAAIAIACILNDRNVIGAVFFSLALNYKQMELYHALPFFVYLLQWCFQEFRQRKLQSIGNLARVGMAVILTFCVLWLPWLHSVEGALVVLRRIFPLARGVFEDKVSNVWCAVNVVVKLKTIFSNEQMALICLATTLLASLPSLLHLFRNGTKRNFVYSLFNCALAFFLFSFQVHEKTILLPALPVMLLFPLEPLAAIWFLQVSVFSMFPLLAKDGLSLAFFALMLVFEVLVQLICRQEPRERFGWLRHVSNLGNTALCICLLFAPVPLRLPFLYPLLISVYCCLHFLMFLVYFNVRQIIGKYKTC